MKKFKLFFNPKTDPKLLLNPMSDDSDQFAYDQSYDDSSERSEGSPDSLGSLGQAEGSSVPARGLPREQHDGSRDSDKVGRFLRLTLLLEL